MSDIVLSSGVSGMNVTAQLYSGASAVGGTFALTEIGSTAEYLGNMPGGTAAGKYLVVLKNGAIKLGSGQINWDGTKEVFDSSLTATAIATQVETAILTEGDGRAVLQAIADKIGNENLSAAAVAAAVRSDMERSGGMLDGKSSQASVTALSNTNQTEHDATQAAIAALPVAPSAVAVAGAVRAELSTEMGRIDVAVSSRLATAGYAAPLNSAQTEAAAAAAIAGSTVQANIIQVNGMSVDGSGTEADPWGPA